MKKLRKSTIAIITAVAILGVSVLILGLIKTTPDQYFFEGYEYFQVYNLGSASPYPNVDKEVEGSLKSVRFSILGAILEGQGGFSPRIVKNDDGDPIYLNRTAVLNMAATAERYLLHFVYKGDIRSIEVDGTKYEYDRAFVFIQEGNGEIVEVRVIPYLFERVQDDSNGVDSADLYEVADLRIKMRTSRLFVSIENAINDLIA